MEANTSGTRNHSDEIDLFELLAQLWHSKVLIICVTSIFALGGIAYLFISTPIFKSTTVIAPPSERNLIEIQKIQSLLDETSNKKSDQASATDIFDLFANALKSNRYKDSYLSRPELVEYFRSGEMTQLQARKAFGNALSIQFPKEKPYNQLTLTLVTTSPELSSRWLNEYIEFSQKRFAKELSNNLEARIEAVKNNLYLTIQSKTANYRSNLTEEIKNTEEALQIAEEIGLEDPLATETIFYKQQVVDQMRGIYHLGSKSLNAELNALRARAKDINSTPGLSDEKLKLELLSNINLNTESISVMTLDLEAEPDPKPVKPQKAIILALSIALGMIIAFLIAFIKIMIKQRN